MDGSTAAWVNTTHDWAATVDLRHLARIRRDPAEFAPGGPVHLVLEVVAYAADEASSRAGGRCLITLHCDGSVSVADNGRGTDTRVGGHGRLVKKPVMATRDLRFFGHPDAERLPDGYPRRGMSVVSALSEWLVHTNRRLDGAWTQHYERGVPVTGLEPLRPDGSTGTTVRFAPAGSLRRLGPLDADDLTRWTARWPDLEVRLDDRRDTGDRPAR
ncbi:ATP-binding protein [Streptomyces sp. NPDC005727]|uniref:ATP-binding protein n=1 Tax=Streptomyces sp. NPDC005727 TaxID=3157053 RepID=UPI00340CA458